MIPDPCTLLFGVPSEAPGAGDPWNVAHWSHLAGRAGLTVRPSPTTSGHGDPTWCGDVDIDGLVYRVHRGLRKRVPVQYADGSEGFEFEQSVWAEPVVASARRPDPCPWCDDGPPSTLRFVGEGDADGVYVVGVSEFADGDGRSILFMNGPQVVLEPGAHTAGGAAYHLAGTGLRLTLTDAAALPVGPELSFRLDLPPGHHEMLAAGLARVWSL